MLALVAVSAAPAFADMTQSIAPRESHESLDFLDMADATEESEDSESDDPTVSIELKSDEPIMTAEESPESQPPTESVLGAGFGDYSQLQWFARLAALGYCARPHHHDAIMDARACPAEACAHTAFDSLQIKRVFEFPGLLEVGLGFIGLDHSAKALYLVYKGSASTRDWVKNLNAIPVLYVPVVHTSAEFPTKIAFECRKCRIHKGFGTFTKTNGATILRAMQHYMEKYPKYRVVVAGHSLGGALALISAVELRLMGHQVLVVTLGAPRVGNLRFVRFVDALFDTARAVAHIDAKRSFAELPTALVRMVHRHDVVPMLPPTRLYRHAGYEYFLGAAGVVQTEETVQRGALDYNNEARREFGRRPPRDYSTIDHVGYFYRVSTCRGEKGAAG